MKRETRIAAPVFAAIPVVILSAAVFCTHALAYGASPAWRLLFRPICHGIPRRCLELWNVPMPICARCTAIYVGLFVGLLLFAAMPWIDEKIARIFMYVAAVPIAIDGVTQGLGLRESTNTLRLITGGLAAFAFGVWVLAAIEHSRTNGRDAGDRTSGAIPDVTNS